jgi:plasmid stabilization system protein ParE
LRYWLIHGFKHHCIFYRPLPDGIEVVRILHAAQDLESALE